MTKPEEEKSTGWFTNQSMKHCEHFYGKVKAAANDHTNEDVIEVLLDPTNVENSDKRRKANRQLFAIMIKMIPNNELGMDLTMRLTQGYDDKGYEAMKYLRDGWKAEAGDGLAKSTYQQYQKKIGAMAAPLQTNEEVKSLLTEVTVLRNQLELTSYAIAPTMHSRNMVDYVMRMSEVHEDVIEKNPSWFTEAKLASPTTVQLSLESVFTTVENKLSNRKARDEIREDSMLTNLPTSGLGALVTKLVENDEAMRLLTLAFNAKKEKSQSQPDRKRCQQCGLFHGGQCRAQLLADGKDVPGWDQMPESQRKAAEKRAEEIKRLGPYHSRSDTSKGKFAGVAVIDLSNVLSHLSVLDITPGQDDFVIRVDTQAGVAFEYHYICDEQLFFEKKACAPIRINGIGDGAVVAREIGTCIVVDSTTGETIELQNCLYAPALGHNLFSPDWAWRRRHTSPNYVKYIPCAEDDKPTLEFFNESTSLVVPLSAAHAWVVRVPSPVTMPVDTSIVQRGRGPVHFDVKPLSARDRMEFDMQNAMLNDPAPARLRAVHKLIDGTSDVLKKANANNTASMARMLANGPQFATREREEPVATKPGEITQWDLCKPPCVSILGNTTLAGFYDACVRYIKVYPMRLKSDAPKALRVYINLCKKYGIPVEEGGILYGDNEIVLNSKEVNESAASEGMLRGNSNEYEPWQNAGVESVFRILFNEMRKLHSRSGVPWEFWDFSAIVSELILNHTREHIEGVSIGEAFGDPRCDLDRDFKMFGCRTVVRKPLPKRDGKLDEQNLEGANLGRARNKPGWWVWTPAEGLMSSSNVTFFPNDFPFKTGAFTLGGSSTAVARTGGGSLGSLADIPHFGGGGGGSGGDDDDDGGNDGDVPDLVGSDAQPDEDDSDSDDDTTPRAYDGHQADTEVEQSGSDSESISHGTPDDVDTSGDSYMPSSESSESEVNVAALLIDTVKRLERARNVDALAARVVKKSKVKTKIGEDGIPLPWQSLKVASDKVQQIFNEAEWKEIQGILDTGAAYEVRAKDLPAGEKVYQTLTIRNVKNNGPNKGKAKVRVCVQRGPEREDSHSPTMLMPTMRALLALVAGKRAKCKTGDFPQAYLNADQEPYHVWPPKTARQYDEQGNRLAWALPKALYGGRKSGRHWYDMLRKWFLDHGFSVSEWDPCLFFKVDSDGAFHYVGVYVDDLIHVYTHEDKYAEVVTQFKKDFHGYTDLGEATEIFNAEIDMNDKFVTLTQTRYIEKMRSQFLPADQEVYKTHTPSHPDLVKAVLRAAAAESSDLDEVSHAKYRSLVAAMNYAAQVCRPDVAVTVSLLARGLEKPSQELLDAALRALRYLVTYKDLGLRWTVGGDTTLFGSTDSDWSVVKSTTGYVFWLCQAAIAYISKKQAAIAISSTEAEIMAASLGALEALFLRGILDEMRCAQHGPTVIGIDNQGAVALARNYVSNSKTKHIERRHLKIRELVEEMKVRPEFVPTNENPADLFTKPLGRPKFEKFRRMIMNHA